MIVDLFAGPGGWEVGANGIGLKGIVGVEYDKDACATRAAAGLTTIRADVSTLRVPELTGLIASPPCTAFSTAGKKAGVGVRDKLCEAIMRRDWSYRPDPDPNIWLVLEVGRWVEGGLPDWIVCEQVSAVLPIWQTYAMLFRTLGYEAWAGTLRAEEYGVPQTRKRAVLMAARGGINPPTPTHQRYEKRKPDGGRYGLLKPWVSMAEALGWDGQVGFARRDDTGTAEDGYRERDRRDTNEPAFATTEKARSWTVRGTTQDHAAERRPDEPAPTVLGGNSGDNLEVNTGRNWRPGGDRSDAQTRSVGHPAPSIDGKGRWHLDRQPGLPDHGVTADVADAKPWATERPATTVAGRALVPDPGANANRFNKATKSRNDGIRVEIGDVLVLQSFPRDYPLRGSRTEQFRQVGNAIPPLLAAAVLGEVLSSEAGRRGES